MKRTICFITCIFVLLCASAYAASALIGDANGDGEVNNKDVVTLFRHISGADVACIEANCDVNGDKEIDNKDVVALFRRLSGYETDGPYGMNNDEGAGEDSGDFSELFG